MATKKQIIGKLSTEQISKWKAKYPSGVWEVSTKDSEGIMHITYVRKPDVQAIGAAAKYTETDPIRSGEILFNTLRLGGSEAVLSDDEMRLSVTKKIGELFKVKEAEIKKL